MTGNYGHFMVYAPAEAGEARDYGVARYGMEVQRLCSVLDSALEGKEYLVGGEYTIADMACFPWFQTLRGKGYNRPRQPDTFDFLSVAQYTNLVAWADRILARPAVFRGMRVRATRRAPRARPVPSRRAAGDKTARETGLQRHPEAVARQEGSAQALSGS
jgi:GST-like protein